MTFADEAIQAFLNEAEKAEQRHHIQDGPVQIGDQVYEFEERHFFEELMTVYLPKEFTELPEHLRRMKYPYEQRPQIIQSDDTGAVTFTFSKLDQELEEESVEELTLEMKGIIKRTNPAHVFFSEAVEEKDGRHIGYFEFKSPALDQFIYQIMFFFVLGEVTGMGTFSCPYKEYEAWRETAFQVIGSIKVAQEDGGEGDTK
jgi:hypothetical protein